MRMQRGGIGVSDAGEFSAPSEDTTAELTHEEWIKRFDPDSGHIRRFEFLADGIFAIALTLLAIELHAPEHWDGTLAGLGKELIAGLKGYFFAFTILAAVWSEFRRSTAMLFAIDNVAIAIGIIQLFFVGLTPPTVALLAKHTDKPMSGVMYLTLFIALYLSSTLFWWHIAHYKKLIRADLPEQYRNLHLLQRLCVLAALIFLLPFMMYDGNFSALGVAGTLSTGLSVVCIIVSFYLRRRDKAVR